MKKKISNYGASNWQWYLSHTKDCKCRERETRTVAGSFFPFTLFVRLRKPVGSVFLISLVKNAQ